VTKERGEVEKNTYIYVTRKREREKGGEGFVADGIFAQRIRTMKRAGKTADPRDEIGTFESEPNENVTESASPLKAKFFPLCDCNSRLPM